MANSSSPDYRKLFLQAEERQRQAEERQRQEEERRKQAEERQRQEEERRKQAEERQKQAEERQKQAEERQKQAEDEGRQDRERNQRTTFVEFMQYCHDKLSRPLRAEISLKSTTGTIPLPTGKYCPTRLELWTDCQAQQQELYNSVYRHLQLASGDAPRLFPPLIELEGLGRRFARQPISSEQDLENYERIAIEDHVRDIISELCKLPAARDEFRLGDGIWFNNHMNSLNEITAPEVDASQPSSIHRPRPDQFCIHRVDGDTTTLLTTVEYKPPHKLSEETLRQGLQPMDLWKVMVGSNKIPTGREAKLRYNAERLVCSAIVQEYHVMIQEGLEYSYVTNGIVRVLLRVLHDDPSTLYYHFCDPNQEVEPEAKNSFQQPKTSVARVLCLCLMAFRSPVRGQEWRNHVRPQLPIWNTSFDHTRSQIPKEELQTLPHSDNTSMEFPSPESGSAYELPSSPPESPTAQGRRVSTRSQARCAPSNIRHRTQSPDSSGSDSNQATGRKRGFSEVTSSPSAQQAARQEEIRNIQGSQSQHHDTQFCTQRCLLGLQTGGILDNCCPNVKLHCQGQEDDLKHPITSEELVCLLKEQLDENIDRCTPIGSCGAYGAPFKLTCAAYGYTVVGKGTTSGLWKEVSREAQVYHILRKAQGSAVPVFLGTIDLAKIYFLHGAGEIRHMLVMGWGGERTAIMELKPWLRREIHRSNKEIKAMGITHEDLRRDNILWNKELGRVLIIDFHRSTLRRRPISKRLPTAKRQLCTTESGGSKRLRVL